MQTRDFGSKLKAITIFALLIFGITLSTSYSTNKDSDMNIYNFTAKTIDGADKSLSDYKGKILLIVNVASNCGFTKQYAGLESLYKKYKDKGVEILAFPCNQFGSQEPGTSTEIKDFCSVNYGVSFQLFDKIDVNGDNAHPIYKYITKAQGGLITDAIKWNFTKFLVDREGNVVDRFAPQTTPESIEKEIEKLL